MACPQATPQRFGLAVNERTSRRLLFQDIAEGIPQQQTLRAPSPWYSGSINGDFAALPALEGLRDFDN